ncbi:MAG: 4-hydroxy-tetrahydrodipicolinate synthase [Gammaproteobacteria bacterium]|nr:4-hydroxy-tetrahydrodipicolinate synthase [Gammaproteobacteria bacterium]
MFQGSMVALVTPMHENGDIDHPALSSLIEFHIENNTDAIIVAGTSGESATLTTKEHCDLIKTVVDQVNKRIPVIAGTGANSTHEAIELTQCAKENGADACLLVSPYYNKPTQEGLYQHHKLIAETVDIPQILYNVPGRTAVDFLPSTVVRLADLKNIVGIKEASGDLDRIRELCFLLGSRVEVYSGDDATAMESILLGAKGDISVTANVAPKQMHEMCQYALNGEKDKASEINSVLDILHQRLFLESNPIPAKWALHEMGMIQTGIRLPLTPLDSQYRQLIVEALKANSIL